MVNLDMRGILVAADQNQEWLLPWWWENYIKHNSYPVTFVDFGMSQEACNWCNTKGTLIKFPFSLAVETTESLLAEGKRMLIKDVHQSRQAWFKKPLAFTLTPFEQTLWLDSDCEVLGSLAPLFNYCGLSLAREGENSNEYNSGVVLYQKNCPIIQEWAEASKISHPHHVGDQTVLTDLIHTKNLPIFILPRPYHSLSWRIRKEVINEPYRCI